MRDAPATQVALYEALTYAGLTVYDEVPPEVEQEPGNGYVVIGETTEQPDDTHDRFGTSETVLLHFWSRAKGAKEVKDLMRVADLTLHQATLLLPGGGSVYATRAFAEVFTEETETGEVWRHGVMRFRLRTAA